MSKRHFDFVNSATKKLKLKADDFDDSWEDDLDDKAIEDCLQRATQNEVLQNQQKQETSFSYTFFKEATRFTTSTQSHGIASSHTVENKIQLLQSKCAEKEGEVSILRAKLQNLQETAQSDHNKQQNEWTEKLHLIEKENRGVKAEVEFKSLEIAHLKQQVLKLSKLVNAEQNATQVRIVDLNTNGSLPEQENKDVNFKVSINNEAYYPLICYGFSNKPCSNEFHENTVLNSTNVKNEICSRKKIGLNDVCSELSYLSTLSEDELETEAVIPYINKVFYVSIHLLSDLLAYLEQAQKPSESEYMQDLGAHYMAKLSLTGNAEIGVDCSQILDVLVSLLPYSSYLKECLLEKQPLRTINGELFKKDSIFVSEKQKHSPLELLPNIISMIGFTKKEHLCSRFLKSVLKLMLEMSNTCYADLLTHVSQEMLLLQPKREVILKVTFFLKEACKCPKFISSICFNSKKKFVKNEMSDGLLYFDKDVCRLTIFLNVLEIEIQKAKNEQFYSQISSNVLDLMYNLFTVNGAWLNQPENKACECLTKLYKFVIGIIYVNSTSRKIENGRIKSIRKRSIKILHLMTWNSYSLIQKYVIAFSQFKESVHMLLQVYEGSKKLKDLAEVYSEDCPEVPSEKFVALDF